MRALIMVALLAGATLSHAQTTTTSPKKELVAKLLALQQGSIEGLARNIAEEPAVQMMQAAGAALQSQVAPDRREATAKAIQAEARKYADEAVPLVRDRAVKLAPTALGPALEEKFSEDELKQLIAWLENPVNRKYQQFTGEMQGPFTQKLVADTRPAIGPKLQALEQNIRAVLISAAQPPASAPKAAASGAARAPARAASK